MTDEDTVLAVAYPRPRLTPEELERAGLATLGTRPLTPAQAGELGYPELAARAGGDPLRAVRLQPVATSRSILPRSTSGPGATR